MNEEKARGYLSTVVGCYCPRCREGKLFQHPTSININKNMAMYPACIVCGQPTDIEVGFYYGTGYISYLIALAISAISFITWWIIIGFSFEDRRFLFWVIFNAVLLIVLQPWLMRFSRSLWISFFVRYNPDWRDTDPGDNERVIESHMGNW